MVPADSHRIPRVPRYSGYCYASYRFVYAAFMLYGCTFQNIPLTILLAMSQSYNPSEAGTSLVWALPRSLATTRGITNLFSLPPGTKMFQFPGLASVSKRMTYLQYAGFSHSDTPWSMAVCASHGIFAAYRVLRRLREPRHPPYALVHFCLTIACVLHDEGNVLRIQGRCCSGLTAQDQKQILDRLLLTLKSVVVAFNVSVCPLSH